jgi:HEAT repeat protein
MNKAPSSKSHRVDGRLQQDLLEFIHAILSLRKAFVLYGRGNVMLAEALKKLRAAEEGVFAGREIVPITVAGKNLFVGNVLLSQGSPFVRELVENMRCLIIRRLSFARGVREEELYTLMEMLSSEPKPLLLKGGPAAFLAEKGVKNIHVIENVYVKRVGQLDEIDLGGERIDVEELQLIRQQLMNYISLRVKGIELRDDERRLLSELGNQPTFMAALVKEMAAGEVRESGPADRRARGEKMSEIFELLLSEMKKDPRCDERFLGRAFSEAMEHIDEPLRLEVLGAQFRMAGGLPSVLKDGIFNCSRVHVGEFILDACERGKTELTGKARLLKRLLPSESVLGEVISYLERRCHARGVECADMEKLLRETVGAGLKPGFQRGDVPAEEASRSLNENIRRLKELTRIEVDELELTAFLEKGCGEQEKDEILVVSELLGAGEVTAETIKKVGARIKGLLQEGEAESACAMFGALVKLLKSGEGELVQHARAEVMRLCEEGTLRSVLTAPLGGVQKGSLLAEIVGSVPMEDVRVVWKKLSSDEGAFVREAMMEAARREPRAVAVLLQSQLAAGRGDRLSNAVDIMGVLPREEASPVLKSLCRHDDPAVRVKAVSALVKISGTEVLPLLIEMIEDTDSEVRRSTIPLLGHVGAREGVDKLIEIAGDERGKWDVEERSLACRALSKIGRENAIPTLARILKEKRGGPKGARAQTLFASARFALQRIGGPLAEAALREEKRQGRGFVRRLFEK